jgi:peptidoglycan/xylan/chitin deacetylase (PgdA/CDA1 family)
VRGALLIVYHDIAPGPPPLCVEPGRFREHLDCLADCEATVLTVSALAQRLRQGRLPPRAVCITFDDGFASVVDKAVPLLLEREFSASVFCVAGYLGRTSGWPTQRRRIEARPLASACQLRELAAAGFEIGAHGFEHRPLRRAREDVLRRELVEARSVLEQEIGVGVTSFAYAYGSAPSRLGMELVAATYLAACTTTPRIASPVDDLLALPRVDAHYLRHPELLRRVLVGSGEPYLALRRAGARTRRLVLRDFAPP